jgi:hypothetical protein
VQGMTIARFGPSVMMGNGIAGNFGPVTILALPLRPRRLRFSTPRCQVSGRVRLCDWMSALRGTTNTQVGEMGAARKRAQTGAAKPSCCLESMT